MRCAGRARARKFAGDIAVRDGLISAIGTAGAVRGSGATEIDAGGKLVTPGWVDIHSVRSRVSQPHQVSAAQRELFVTI
eukprot:SAG31_NODE_119_length_23948_cov_9.957105_7_plen_79_part_00